MRILAGALRSGLCPLFPFAKGDPLDPEAAARARLWELGKGVNPAWAQYQKKTERTLPVVVLSPLQS